MPIAENDILKMAQKIQQNESENNVYKKQLDKYFSGEMPSHEVINVCSTPNVLKLLDSTAKKVVLNQKDLENAVAESKSGSKGHTEGHDISKEEIYKLSEAIRNPIMVLKGNKRNQNSVVLITDLINKKGEKVFVPIALDKQNGRISTISSLYGKKNLSKYISEHLSDVLAANKEKVGMLADTRDQYSQSISDTVTYYDDSIAYTTANVKYPSQNEQEKSEVSKVNEPEQIVKMKEFDIEIKNEDGVAEAWDSDTFQDPIKAETAEEAIALAQDYLHERKVDSIKYTVDGKSYDKYDKEINFDEKILIRAAEIKFDKEFGEQIRPEAEDWVYSDEISDSEEQTKIHNSILASQASKLEVKIARIEDNNTAITNKIAENERKIEAQQARIDEAQKSKEYYKELLDTTALPKPLKSFITSVMNRQDKIIENCNNRIAKSTNKNAVLKDKIAENEKAIEKHKSKIGQLQKVENFLKNMHFKEGRRENFIKVISELRNWSLKKTQSRLEKLEARISKKELALSAAATATEKVQLRNQLSQLNERKDKLEDKINKLTAMTNKLDKLSSLSEQQADEVVKVATQNIESVLNQNKNRDADNIVTTVLDEADKSLDNIDEIVSKIVKEFRKQQAEQQKTEQTSTQDSDFEERSKYVTALCAYITDTFNAHYNPERHILNTNAVFSELSGRCNLDDVKSIIATAILDRHHLGDKEGKLTAETEKWAISQPLSEKIKNFVKEQGSIPLDMKFGFFEVFAKKFGMWEQTQVKENSVLSRKDITKNAAKIHEQQPKSNTQEKSAQHKKNDQSL